MVSDSYEAVMDHEEGEGGVDRGLVRARTEIAVGNRAYRVSKRVLRVYVC